MKCEMRFGVTRSWVNCGSVGKEDIVTIRSISFAISRCVLSSPNFKWDTTSILQNAQLGGYANMLSGSALWWQCRPLSITVHTFQPTTSSNRWTYNDPVAINCTHRRWPRFLSFAYFHINNRDLQRCLRISYISSECIASWHCCHSSIVDKTIAAASASGIDAFYSDGRIGRNGRSSSIVHWIDNTQWFMNNIENKYRTQIWQRQSRCTLVNTRREQKRRHPHWKTQ